MTIRPIKRLSQSRPTLEGAGVHLRRAFGFGDTTEHDPFLLLDDFRSDVPEHYRAGFPWHPHRGIETITYVLAGSVEHGDSLGNRGSIGPGDVQWMTAGGGIVHQEMPQGDAEGRMYGFQLWANLPAALKMAAPRYQDIKAADIPEARDGGGTRARVICGTLWGTTGPVTGVAADPIYLDVTVAARGHAAIPAPASRQAFAYVFDGSGGFGEAGDPVANRTLVLFGDGDEVVAHAGDDGLRFLLCAGKPLREPVAWRGPIVMNTQEELELAFRELHEGTFLKGGNGAGQPERS
jgi:quercetin 2,3-dioxygenase